MADIRSNCPTDSTAFREAVCIDAGRVYDSCCDRDCLRDLRCYFSEEGQQLINNALSVRTRSAEVIDVNIDVEPVSFNRGYYSCDLTFFFKVELDVFTAPHTCPTVLNGITYTHKKAILFGSEGSVKSFSNCYTVAGGPDKQGFTTGNVPKCVVQCVDPIALSAKLCDIKDCCDCNCCIPKRVCDCIGGNINTGNNARKGVYTTLGLFSIVQLIRNVQMLIPVYDFCIPDKQCSQSSDSPCDVFSRIDFPTDDFFPPRPCDENNNCGCQSDSND